MRLLGLPLFAMLVGSAVFSQSNTSGDIAGIVTDPTRTSIGNAYVLIENLTTGFRQAATSRAGTFRVPLLPPGDYQVTVSASGFQIVKATAAVVVGGTAPVNLTLPVKTKFTSVDVWEESTRVELENGDIQSVFDANTIENLPNPGGDITFYPQLVAGADHPCISFQIGASFASNSRTQIF